MCIGQNKLYNDTYFLVRKLQSDMSENFTTKNKVAS